ncbi:MAG: NADH:flavin oxidoreductase [Synergistaceae bacterium]|jgi:2,4-dienoyl-CoA reductase-like NADH-dependent reductase (Old Yellow Enzyme family)|nr:NADH:flavin oxidoreductase [Synergistaceae bacterium]
MDVFDGIEIAGTALPNRFVRSATWEGMATEEGAVTPELTQLMKALAEGGTGLLITSHAYVRKDGQASLRQVAIDDDVLLPGLRGMCDAAHGAGTKIFAQLAHAGVNANSALSGREPLGPTETQNALGTKVREMTEEDIALLTESFADAARRAVKAGFDGVQIHAAHAYCLGEFLSPFYNRRTDVYGGSVENRARALIEVYRAVRKVTGSGYPVVAKINSEDFIDGGLTPSMMVETALIMESEGFDAVEVSGGGGPIARYSSHRLRSQAPDGEVYYRDAARLYRTRVKKMPLMLVGGIRSLETAREIVREGLADMIAISRPLICEPDLVRRWASGNTRRSPCVSCERCLEMAAEGRGLRCALNEGADSAAKE